MGSPIGEWACSTRMKFPVIQRENQILAVLRYLSRHRVVAVVGARQVGKTTLARQVAARAMISPASISLIP